MAVLDGNPWFVARDVLAALAMDVNQSQNYTKHLSSDEKKLIRRGYINPVIATLFSPRGGSVLGLISESGLYKLVMRSDKPEAKGFQDWVTREVLPAICCSLR